MAIYTCTTCGYEYDEEEEGQPFDSLHDDWQCPVCGVEKDFFEPEEEEEDSSKAATTKQEPATKEQDDYLKKWEKASDPHESYMAQIHKIAKTGESITEPMGTTKPVISWDDVLIRGAQLAKIPIEKDVDINTQTVIGKNAKYPLVLESPIIISHMSFGALSKEFKTALSKGSAAAKTAICSGEGGILPDELANAYKYIFEYIPNEYSFTEEYLQQIDAIEIKIGQAAKPGMGGHLPGSKVTQEIANVRNKPVGKEIHSPSAYSDIRSSTELKAKVEWLRNKTNGKPVGVKIAAGNLEKDLNAILQADPDFVTIDGRGGATASAPKHIKDSTSVPTLFALYRTHEFLQNKGRGDIAIIITGGLRVSSDFAKAIAMGATAIAIASSAMIAGGCQQYRICHTGNCPVGIATQDEELRKRIDIAKSAKRIENFLHVSTDELKDFARITGHLNVHGLNLEDLCTTNSEISQFTDIEHV